MRVYSFKCERELIEKLDKIALIKNTTRSELIRRAIKAYLENQGNARKVIVTRRIRIE